MRQCGKRPTSESQSCHSAAVACRTVNTSVDLHAELPGPHPHIVPVQVGKTGPRERLESPHKQRCPPAAKLCQVGDLCERRCGRRTVAPEHPAPPQALRREPWLRGEEEAESGGGSGVEHFGGDIATGD